MAKTLSSRTKSTSSTEKPKSSKRTRSTKSPKGPKGLKGSLCSFWRKLRRNTKKLINRIKDFRSQHLHLHKTFRRSYREDYLRPTETPGLLSHAMLTFKTVFRHWKVFLPFVLLMAVLYIISVGLMSEETYQEFQTAIDEGVVSVSNGRVGNFAKAGLILISTVTTGGLATSSNTEQTALAIVLFMIVWLVTLYLLRHFFAGEHPKLRDGLYNALTPLISTLVIACVVIVQLIPVMLLIVAYDAALLTDFLATPFYALLFFVFALLMLTLTGYFLSSSLIALVAVTTPGLYPMKALFAASDLTAGRRIRIVLRILYLFIVIAFIYIIPMLPIILLDLWLKSSFEFLAAVPIVPCCLVIVTCFVFVYATTYIYQYYRWLLNYDNTHQES